MLDSVDFGIVRNDELKKKSRLLALKSSSLDRKSFGILYITCIGH